MTIDSLEIARARGACGAMAPGDRDMRVLVGAIVVVPKLRRPEEAR